MLEKVSWISSDLDDFCKASLFQALSNIHTILLTDFVRIVKCEFFKMVRIVKKMKFFVNNSETRLDIKKVKFYLCFLFNFEKKETKIIKKSPARFEPRDVKICHFLPFSFS